MFKEEEKQVNRPVVKWATPEEIAKIRNVKVSPVPIQKKGKHKTRRKRHRKSEKQLFCYIRHTCVKCKKTTWLQIPFQMLGLLYQQAKSGYTPKIPEGVPILRVNLYGNKKAPVMRKQHEKS